MQPQLGDGLKNVTSTFSSAEIGKKLAELVEVDDGTAN